MSKINNSLASALIIVALFSSCKDDVIEKTENENSKIIIKDTLKSIKKVISN